MPILLGWKEVLAQSKTVFNQFGKKWQETAELNNQLPRKNTHDLHNMGIGKHLLCCAMGESLAENIDIIKKYRDRVEVFTCDKGFKPLLEHGVKADYVMLCDTNINYDINIKDVIEDTKDVKLIATPYANYEWTSNWKGDRYFYINKDSIESEKLFIPLFGNDARLIPAGSNVSNAMIIFMVGADFDQNINFAGYEKYLLIGYDYSWSLDGDYYAWRNPIPKRYYMNHRTMLDMNWNMVVTSENLLFSCKWLYSYITSFQMPVVNCSGKGLLEIPWRNFLENELMVLNPKTIENCKKHYENMRFSYFAHQAAKELFEKSRQELLHKKIYIDMIQNN